MRVSESPFLPDWLFYSETDGRRSARPSPTAIVDPVSAVSGGDPFQSLSTPADAKKKKVLIVTDALKDEFEVIEYLHDRGFTLISWSDDPAMRKCCNPEEELAEDEFSSLCAFDARRDYKILAETFRLPRDNAVILDDTALDELTDYFETHSLSDAGRTMKIAGPWVREITREEKREIKSKETEPLSEQNPIEKLEELEEMFKQAPTSLSTARFVRGRLLDLFSAHTEYMISEKIDFLIQVISIEISCAFKFAQIDVRIAKIFSNKFRLNWTYLGSYVLEVLGNPDFAQTEFERFKIKADKEADPVAIFLREGDFSDDEEGQEEASKFITLMLLDERIARHFLSRGIMVCELAYSKFFNSMIKLSLDYSHLFPLIVENKTILAAYFTSIADGNLKREIPPMMMDAILKNISSLEVRGYFLYLFAHSHSRAASFFLSNIVLRSKIGLFHSLSLMACHQTIAEQVWRNFSSSLQEALIEFYIFRTKCSLDDLLSHFVGQGSADWLLEQYAEHIKGVFEVVFQNASPQTSRSILASMIKLIEGGSDLSEERQHEIVQLVVQSPHRRFVQNALSHPAIRKLQFQQRAQNIFNRLSKGEHPYLGLMPKEDLEQLKLQTKTLVIRNLCESTLGWLQANAKQLGHIEKIRFSSFVDLIMTTPVKCQQYLARIQETFSGVVLIIPERMQRFLDGDESQAGVTPKPTSSCPVRSPFVCGRMEENVLYGSTSSSVEGTSLGATAASDIALHYQPLFKIISKSRDPNNTPARLKALMRMSLVSCFAVGDDNKLAATELVPDHKIEIESQAATRADAMLEIMNAMQLKHLSGRYYAMPVLADNQKLMRCIGGTIYRDPIFGRWILETENLSACEITIAIPPLGEMPDDMNSRNYLNEVFNGLPGIDLIRNFFAEKDSAFCFGQCNRDDMTCGKRTRQMLSSLCDAGISAETFYYASSGGHAYLAIRHEGRVIKVDLGGGGMVSKTYDPVPEAAAEAAAAETPPAEAPPADAEAPPAEAPPAEAPPADAAASAATEEKLAALLMPTSESSLATTSVEALNELLVSKSRLLLTASNLDALANYVLSQSRETDATVFYVDSPEKLVTESSAMMLNASGVPHISTQSFLELFLARAESNPGKPYRLMINWDKLSPKDRVRLNGVLDDRDPRLLGIPLLGNVQIISLCGKVPDDPSFTSRHSCITAVSPRSIRPRAASLASEEAINRTIDLCGHARWQQALLGSILLDGGHCRWEKSEFVKALEQTAPSAEPGAREAKGEPAPRSSSTITFTLQHFPAAERKQIEYFLAQARAQGYFDYHGCRIPFPDSVRITLDGAPFDFSDFSEIIYYQLLESMPEHMTDPAIFIINSQYFDCLLQTATIEDGLYSVKPGLIEQHAKRALTLLITSELSEEQWYLLCREAQKHAVRIVLQLAPGVKLPRKLARVATLDRPDEGELEAKGSAPETPPLEPSEAAPRPAPLVIDIEDQSFQTLCQRVGFERTESGLTAFKMISSALLEALLRGRDVVLRGECPDYFRQQIEPLLIRQGILIDGKWRQFRGRLTLESDKSPALDVEKERYFLEEAKPELGDPATWTKEAAKAFVEKRKTDLLKCLERSPWVQLVGETGVGKSQLMKEFAGDDRATVYRELDQLGAWATDPNTERVKILFIDESNIEDMHFTFLSPLGSDDSTILYKGKLYPLDDRHKVVFARNPHDYGGGRVKQKLFAQHAIPAIKFEDFSPAYLYQHLLKPLFDAMTFFSDDEEVFRQSCKPIIETYLASGKKSIRQLHEGALGYFLREDMLEASGRSSLFSSGRLTPTSTTESSYVLTAAHRELSVPLERLFRKKRGEKMRWLPAFSGFSGCLIKGPSGCGKSVFVQHMLETSEEYKGRYIHLDAGMSLEQIKANLLRAFHKGQAVWMDEINSITSTGIEKLLNSLLTGIDSYGKPPRTPGFVLLATANGVDLPGRSCLSPALEARFLVCEMPMPRPDDVSAIIASRYPGRDLSKVIGHVQELMAKNPSLTLRTVLMNLDEIISVVGADELPETVAVAPVAAPPPPEESVPEAALLAVREKDIKMPLITRSDFRRFLGGTMVVIVASEAIMYEHLKGLHQSSAFGKHLLNPITGISILIAFLIFGGYLCARSLELGPAQTEGPTVPAAVA